MKRHAVLVLDLYGTTMDELGGVYRSVIDLLQDGERGDIDRWELKVIEDLDAEDFRDPELVMDDLAGETDDELDSSIGGGHLLT